MLERDIKTIIVIYILFGHLIFIHLFGLGRQPNAKQPHTNKAGIQAIVFSRSALQANINCLFLYYFVNDLITTFISLSTSTNFFSS